MYAKSVWQKERKNTEKKTCAGKKKNFYLCCVSGCSQRAKLLIMAKTWSCVCIQVPTGACCLSSPRLSVSVIVRSGSVRNLSDTLPASAQIGHATTGSIVAFTGGGGIGEAEVEMSCMTLLSDHQPSAFRIEAVWALPCGGVAVRDLWISYRAFCTQNIRPISVAPFTFALDEPQPNPSGSSLRIKFSTGFASPVRITLLNTVGQVVWFTEEATLPVEYTATR